MAYKPTQATQPGQARPADGLLPLFLVEHEGKEERFYSEKDRQDYFAAHKLHVEAEAEPESSSTSDSAATEATAPTQIRPPWPATAGHRVREIELHEVKMLNKHLVRLRDEFGLRAEVLLPREVTGDEPPPRFLLHRDGETYPLLDLRALVPTVRKIGEKGMKITRFKGLGEMDAEQLWETTMDPDAPHPAPGPSRGHCRRQRPVCHPDGRRRRAAPRVHRKACARGQEPDV